MFQTKIHIELTIPLLKALGQHPSLVKIGLMKSKLGCTLEAELRRFESAILEMAQPPTALKSLILEELHSNMVTMSDYDV